MANAVSHTPLVLPAPSVSKTAWRDVVTLAKPGITALIVTVAIAGFVLASPRSLDALRLGILVATGASASAGAAMLNHYLDRDVDARMSRTRHRPLPGERITPSSTVAVGGLALLAVGIGGAGYFLNPLTGFSIFLGGLTYVVLYTAWLKRRTSWNIVIGGFAGSAPALAGSAAAVGNWTPGVIALAVLVFLWTPPHFWSLAFVLKDDYAKVGLPMLPKMNDLAYSGKVIAVSAALLVPAAALIGWTGVVCWPVLLALLVLGAIFVGLTAPLWHHPSRRIARRGFVFSGPYLLLVLLACIANGGLLAVGWRPGL
jgi:heme o synthase